jgi:3'(2'), 5'-bisphosphate nucleotidase
MVLQPLFITAINAAIQASIEIKKIYDTQFDAQFKPDGSPITIADLTSSKIILKWLIPTAIPIIDEEQAHAPYEERRNWEYCWCVDPLDGTKEFVKKNGEFAVNIALIHQGIPVFGVIASPVERTFIFGGATIGGFTSTFQAWETSGKFQQIKPQPLKKELTLIASASHHTIAVLDYFQELSQNQLNAQFIQKGSSLKFFELTQNTAQIYPRTSHS